MAAPSAPTATTICTAALKRFYNGTTPEPDDVTRAEDEGLEKVKRDIMGLGRTWRPLLRTVFDVTKVGVSHYSNPSDYEIDFSIGLMSGTHTGELQTVTSTSNVTLASTETVTKKQAEGKWLLITSGTGKNQAEQIDDYDIATKECVMRAAYATLPVDSDGYMIVSDILDLRNIHPVLYDKYQNTGRPCSPLKYVNLENESVGEIALYPVPDAVFGLRRRYYADLRKVDLETNLYSTLMRRWANVLEQGVYVWKLGEDDDRWATEYQIYQQMLMNLAVTDMAGFDVSKIPSGASE